MHKANSLSDLGFIKDCVLEVIVSTYGTDYTPNAAPMGIMIEDTDRMIIRPYTTTQTYRNILFHKCAVVNITSDPIIFYRTALKDKNHDNEIPQDWFEKSDFVDAPKLRMADAYVEVKTIEMENTKGGRARVLCEVLNVSPILKIAPKGYCRATSALMESIIHATRIKVFLSRDEKGRAEDLIKLVKHYDDVVKRVAPSSFYSDAMKGILKRIDTWKVKDEL